MRAPKRRRRQNTRTATTLKTLLRHGVKAAKFVNGRLAEVEFYPYEFEGVLPPELPAAKAKAGTPTQDQGQDVVREAPKNAMDLVLGADRLPDLNADPGEIPRTPKVERG